MLAHFAKRGNNGNARKIVEAHLRPDMIELPLLYPVTTEIDKDHDDYKSAITDFYDAVGRRRRRASRRRPHGRGAERRRPAVLRLLHAPACAARRSASRPRSSPASPPCPAAGRATGLPIVQGDDVLSVLPGTMAEAELARRLADTDAAVIMKVGRNLPKIRRALQAAGKLQQAVYVERGTMDNAASMRLADKPDDNAPYFALVLVPGWEQRP